MCAMENALPPVIIYLLRENIAVTMVRTEEQQAYDGDGRITLEMKCM